MNLINERVIEFLRNYRMDYTDLNFEDICDAFLKEMEQGLSGRSSDLQMLPTFIETGVEVPVNQRVLALDAGGTNFRVATVYFDREGKPVIENFQKYPMPGVEAAVDKTVLFQTMARYAGNVLANDQSIGFCFSYPVEMLPSKDGKLIQFSKQIKASGVEGELIGANLKQALHDLGFKKPGSIVILNDTVATLLAGKAGSRRRVFDGYVGFILGTGVNSCYPEKNRNILKGGKLDLAKSQIINVESGGFTKGLGGALDWQFDRTTADQGRYIMEKMISGKYLGGLAQVVINAAVKDGLFSTGAARGLEGLKELTTVELNNFLEYPHDTSYLLAGVLKTGTETDRTTLYLIIDRLVERAALLAALTLTATVLKTDFGRNPAAPVCITAEGTTFYHLKDLKAKTEFYLKKYLSDRHNRYWRLVNIENATLIGAAVAGLTN